MKTLIVAGPSSNSGKTTLITELLKRLPGKWGAVKWTSAKKENSRLIGPDQKYALVESPEILEVPGKDTFRYKQAGAHAVFWLIAPVPSYREAWEEVKKNSQNKGLTGLLIEGYQCIQRVPHQSLIFTINLEVPQSRWKKDYLIYYSQADFLHIFPREKRKAFLRDHPPSSFLLDLQDSGSFQFFLGLLSS